MDLTKLKEEFKSFNMEKECKVLKDLPPSVVKEIYSYNLHENTIDNFVKLVDFVRDTGRKWNKALQDKNLTSITYKRFVKMPVISEFITYISTPNVYVEPPQLLKNKAYYKLLHDAAYTNGADGVKSRDLLFKYLANGVFEKIGIEEGTIQGTANAGVVVELNEKALQAIANGDPELLNKINDLVANRIEEQDALFDKDNQSDEDEEEEY